MSLERRKPLKRTPLKRSRKRIAQRSAKAVTMEPLVDAFREALRYRSRGMCEVRSPACPDGPHLGAHGHHVWPSDRDRGVHDPERGLYVCFAGHDWIHSHPTMARELRWLMRSTDT